MRILFLSQRFLLPMDTGGKIRTGNILTELAKQHEITVVGNFEASKDAAYLDQMSRFCARYIPVPWTEPRRESLRFYLRVAQHLLSTYPVTALNDYSSELEQALLAQLNCSEFDIAICDFVQSALLFKHVTGIPTLLFQHNVEAKIALRHSQSASNIFAKALWNSQHRRMCEFERNAVNGFDKVIAVSDNDAEIFHAEYGATNAVSIPTGVDVDLYSPGSEEEIDETQIVFCGSMDWLPNEDGIKYFLSTIADKLPKELTWKLVVVGRNPSEALNALAAKFNNVELTGWADDVRPHLRRAALCIVPLRIGGGTRMKIYEAMAMGKAVLSTSIGAEGLTYHDGKDICIADDPNEFAALISQLLNDTARRRRIAAAARELVVAHFGWPRIAEAFADICEETIEHAAH